MANHFPYRERLTWPHGMSLTSMTRLLADLRRRPHLTSEMHAG